VPVPPAAASRYWELSVPTSGDISEALTNFLWELGALGVVEEESPGERPRLRAFFPALSEAAAPSPAPSEPPAALWLAARVRHYLDELGALGFGAAGEPHVTSLLDEGWAVAWREHFRPVPVGRRLVVTPPWETPALPGRLPLVIEPGRAFGTGHHATTSGCLEAMEALIEAVAPARAIDLGTGSGILAIAAALLGVARVLAVDEDPDAIAAAVANAARNRVCDRVRCVLGDAGALEAPPAPLVVANLLTAAHLRLASGYAALVAPGGALVLGGILDGEAPAVAGAVSRHDFALDGSRAIEGWTTLVFVRSGDATLHHRA
jgi:ribosomal protein L11 methyltransferase